MATASMNTVQHGRRFGKQKKIPMQAPVAPAAITIDPTKVTILRRSEWDRIERQLHKRDIAAAVAQKKRDDKLRMYEMSQARSAGWSNTIQGQRQKSLKAFEERKSKLEEEKKIMDIEEAKHQSQQRQIAIDEARTKLYYQSDRIKSLHSAMLLSEVLKERDAQVELHRLKKLGTCDEDRDEADRISRELEDSILRDQDIALKRIRDNAEMQDYLQKQINQHKHQAMKEINIDNKEGQELKRLADDFNKEEHLLKDIRASDARKLAYINKKQIQDNSEDNIIRKLVLEKEDEDCRIFGAAKRKMMKMRIEKEKEIHHERQERLERMRARISSMMREADDDENSRISKAVAEQDAKIERELADKFERAQDQMTAIAKHRDQELKKSAKAVAMDKISQLNELQALKEADGMFHKNEHTKQVKRFHANMQQQKFHRNQINEKDDLNKYERNLVMDQQEKHMQLLKLEEDQFQEYSTKLISESELRGRNIYPMKVASQPGVGGGRGPTFEGKGGVRPSYQACTEAGHQLPHYRQDEAENVKALNMSAPTNKRLGFIW